MSLISWKQVRQTTKTIVQTWHSTDTFRVVFSNAKLQNLYPPSLCSTSLHLLDCLPRKGTMQIPNCKCPCFSSLYPFGLISWTTLFKCQCFQNLSEFQPQALWHPHPRNTDKFGITTRREIGNFLPTNSDRTTPKKQSQSHECKTSFVPITPASTSSFSKLSLSPTLSFSLAHSLPLSLSLSLCLYHSLSFSVSLSPCPVASHP